MSQDTDIKGKWNAGTAEAGCAGCFQLWEERCELMRRVQTAIGFIEQTVDGDDARWILELLRKPLT